LAISDSEGTDTPGRPAGRERTAASDVTEFEYLAGAELQCIERCQDPGKGEIPVPGSVAVKEGRGACHSPQREQVTVLPTVPPPSVIAVLFCMRAPKLPTLFTLFLPRESTPEARVLPRGMQRAGSEFTITEITEYIYFSPFKPFNEFNYRSD